MPPTKKSLGQHWLQDPDSLQAMADAVDLTGRDTVLEVGPGPGGLTAILAQQARRVIAVEFDPALARDLPARVPAANLAVVQQDILQFDFGSLPPAYKVAANIPYYLTSNLLRVLCESPNHFSRAALLVQKEVAQRVAASPGHMSLLSVSVQFYCRVSLGRVVPAWLFAPPPKVDSQILVLAYRETPRFPGVDRRLFFRIVKAGFAQRRKTILNAFGAGLRLSRGDTLALLQAAGIPPAARAQNLSLDEWYAVYKAVAARPAN